MEHYVSSDMTNSLCLLLCGECCTNCGNINLPLVENKFSCISRHEPEPFVRTTTNGDHDETAETPIAATATTAQEQMSMMMTQMMKINMYTQKLMTI